MAKPSDVYVTGTTLYLLPVKTRIPLKFGTETLTSVICARAKVQVSDSNGKIATGWGETPISVQWVWPSNIPFEERKNCLIEFCKIVARAIVNSTVKGHPLEIGYDFREHCFPKLLEEFNQNRLQKMPLLAGLLCCSPFDIAVYDAYGNLFGLPIYDTYTAEFLSRDLAYFLTPAPDSSVSFQSKYPEQYLIPRRNVLRAWHLVGGLDPIDRNDLTGDEPQDGYPVLLSDWILRDGLKCLKIKLRGNDEEWDFERIVKVGEIAIKYNVEWLSTDFNCTVLSVDYVIWILDKLRDEHPKIYEMILYVEQPFPYDLEKNRIDVRSVAARKPIFLDESAHDWRIIMLGRSLGWNGVALKTCKTQTGAILSACWAKAHGMTLMVQDLTNPMLAQIPHVLLAAHLDTIMGVETNSMQFYPEASRYEDEVHPGIYKRKNGIIELSSIRGSGFGYRIDEIKRILPEPAIEISN